LRNLEAAAGRPQASEQLVADIVREVLSRLKSQPSQVAGAKTPAAAEPAVRTGYGVFETVDQAVDAASRAQSRLADMSLDTRGEVIEIVRRLCEDRAQELAELEYQETGIGRLDHKVEKLKIIRRVKGVEALRTEAFSDASGLAILEYAPFGVIGMVLPATHSVPTMAGNAINVIAGGNAAVFSPHPAAAKVAAYALSLFNQEIEKKTGLANVITTVAAPSIKSAEEVFHHPGVALLCVTGGPAVVKAAMKAGKRVIAAGPGNPPAVVDETADLDKAAADIIFGAAFDNNLLCIGEKEVFVVSSVADQFIAAMKRHGAYQLTPEQIEKLTQAAFTFKEGAGKGCGQAHLKSDLIGKDPEVLAAAIGLKLPARVDLLFGETKAEHPFVEEEQMMPFLPIVRVPDIDAAIAAALKAEHGYRHTAMIHSNRIGNVTKMARAMNTTLFVHNAPCSAGLGLGGPGFLSYSIATPTGEGVTSPLTFTRQRQIAVVGGLRII
jgi:aldehyde dehydrogenase